LEVQDAKEMLPQIRESCQVASEDVCDFAASRGRYLMAKIDATHSQLVKMITEKAAAAKSRVQWILGRITSDLVPSVCRFHQIEKKTKSFLKV